VLILVLVWKPISCYVLFYPLNSLPFGLLRRSDEAATTIQHKVRERIRNRRNAFAEVVKELKATRGNGCTNEDETDSTGSEEEEEEKDIPYLMTLIFVATCGMSIVLVKIFMAYTKPFWKGNDEEAGGDLLLLNRKRAGMESAGDGGTMNGTTETQPAPPNSQPPSYVQVNALSNAVETSFAFH
jgi:hypothetical protein